jgi:zinc D-Ala-D-Ala carboxypeptidase
VTGLDEGGGELRRTRVRGLAVGSAFVIALGGAAPAGAMGLAPGETGKHVKRLQVQVAGWFPASRAKVHFALDGVYGAQTTSAVRAFQRHYGLRTDGIAGSSTYAVLRRLGDPDGSTKHFDYSEFTQNHNAACSAQANAYAGSFGGGRTPRRRVRRNVRRVMWRLEAVRAKGKSSPIGINSAFRSVAYNSCIGGAGLSQHMYGTAVDNRMARVPNRRARTIAKRSEFHGIGCYAALTHNHMDVRMDNSDVPGARAWWWPERDRRGRDLDANGRVCWGQRRGRVTTAASRSDAWAISVSELREWARAGELRLFRGAD